MRRSRVEGRMCNAVQGRVPREAVRIFVFRFIFLLASFSFTSSFSRALSFTSCSSRAFSRGLRRPPALVAASWSPGLLPSLAIP